uniref:Uncharacterized protein n=1 Tax=Trichuris muris TaxID=70415 RepID=A0A5S6Q147_TRIMR
MDFDVWNSFALSCCVAGHIVFVGLSPTGKRASRALSSPLKSSPSWAYASQKSPLDRSATARLRRPLYGYLGKCFEQSVNNCSDHPYRFASKLKIAIHRLKPVAPRSSMRAPFIIENLSGYAQVFLQTATKPHGITPVYSGPKTVIRRPDKTVTISMDGRDVTVAIDRTKPAFVDNES